MASKIFKTRAAKPTILAGAFAVALSGCGSSSSSGSLSTGSALADLAIGGIGGCLAGGAVARQVGSSDSGEKLECVAGGLVGAGLLGKQRQKQQANTLQPVRCQIQTQEGWTNGQVVESRGKRTCIQTTTHTSQPTIAPTYPNQIYGTPRGPAARY